MTNEGKGNKPNAARQLEQEEVNVLYETGFFGTHEPIALQLPYRGQLGGNCPYN